MRFFMVRALTIFMATMVGIARAGNRLLQQPSSASAYWHLPARCMAGDVNALFQFRGIWHLMQQWGPNAVTCVGHAVSTDLLHWTRLPDALTPGTSGQGCFDGSVTILKRHGVPTPVMMSDGGCGLANASAGNQLCMEFYGDGVTGAVIAFPANLSDPHLITWTKEPLTFHGCNGSSGPSPMWQNGDAYELIAIHDAGEARFVAVDDSLLQWKMVDPSFIAVRGGGGGLWHELPQNVPGTTGSRWPTHIFQSNGMFGDSLPAFVMGIYDMQTERFMNVTADRLVDIGSNVRYGELSAAPADSNGGDDPRTLHVSWLTIVQPKDTKDCDTGGLLTSIRELQFDPRLPPSGALVEVPIAEYELLRGSLLFNVSGQKLEKEASSLILGTAGISMDIELEVSLNASALWAVEFGVRCESRTTCNRGARLRLASGDSSKHGRTVVMSVQTPDEAQRTSFTVLAYETTFLVRIMLDIASVELFVAGGRGVYSGALKGTGVLVANCSGSDLEISGLAWEMGSIFSSMPTADGISAAALNLLI